MYALLTKGNDQVKIHTTATQVINNHYTAGEATSGPLPLTVTDPEAAARECVDSFIADGWTLTEKEA